MYLGEDDESSRELFPYSCWTSWKCAACELDAGTGAQGGLRHIDAGKIMTRVFYPDLYWDEDLCDTKKMEKKGSSEKRQEEGREVLMREEKENNNNMETEEEQEKEPILSGNVLGKGFIFTKPEGEEAESIKQAKRNNYFELQFGYSPECSPYLNFPRRGEEKKENEKQGVEDFPYRVEIVSNARNCEVYIDSDANGAGTWDSSGSPPQRTYVGTVCGSLLDIGEGMESIEEREEAMKLVEEGFEDTGVNLKDIEGLRGKYCGKKLLLYRIVIDLRKSSFMAGQGGDLQAKIRETFNPSSNNSLSGGVLWRQGGNKTNPSLISSLNLKLLSLTNKSTALVSAVLVSSCRRSVVRVESVSRKEELQLLKGGMGRNGISVNNHHNSRGRCSKEGSVILGDKTNNNNWNAHTAAKDGGSVDMESVKAMMDGMNIKADISERSKAFMTSMIKNMKMKKENEKKMMANVESVSSRPVNHVSGSLGEVEARLKQYIDEKMDAQMTRLETYLDMRLQGIEKKLEEAINNNNNISHKHNSTSVPASPSPPDSSIMMMMMAMMQQQQDQLLKRIAQIPLQGANRNEE
eukprot:Nk52_evm1s940 gene=Nk52_evmTU1s940